MLKVEHLWTRKSSHHKYLLSLYYHVINQVSDNEMNREFLC